MHQGTSSVLRPISVDTDVNAYRRADTAAARHHLVQGSPTMSGYWKLLRFFVQKIESIWAENGLLHENVPRSSLLQDFKNGFPGLKVDDPLPSPGRATRAAMLKNSCGRRRLSSELVFGVQISEHCRTPRSQNKLFFVRNLLCDGLVVQRMIVRSRTWRCTVQSSKMKVMIYAQVFGLTQQHASGAQRIRHMAMVRCYVVVPCSSVLLVVAFTKVLDLR